MVLELVLELVVFVVLICGFLWLVNLFEVPRTFRGEKRVKEYPEEPGPGKEDGHQ